MAQCAESQLRASASAPVGTGGHRAATITFTNKSTKACVLQGYPGAAIVDSTGKQVRQATRTVRGSAGGLPAGVSGIPPVTLQPGAAATSLVEGQTTYEEGAAQAGCDAPNYPGILVTPPNTLTPVPFTVSWPVCMTFTIHPVVAAS